jgi:hypothetical protein
MAELIVTGTTGIALEPYRISRFTPKKAASPKAGTGG